MPYAFNGVGTTYYGNRDPEPDGSYITTEWLVVGYVPLLPLRSFRVLLTEEAHYAVYRSSARYETRRVPLCWRQVGNTYLVAVGILGGLVGFFALLHLWFD